MADLDATIRVTDTPACYERPGAGRLDLFQPNGIAAIHGGWMRHYPRFSMRTKLSMVKAGSFLFRQRRVYRVLLEIFQRIAHVLQQQCGQIPADTVAHQDALN